MRLFTGGGAKNPIRKLGLDNYLNYFGALIHHKSSPVDAISYGVPWALDNNCYSAFNEPAFRRQLSRLQGLPLCTFVCAPDVVGNAAATLALYKHWQPILHNQGYPVALVAQDELEYLSIPWSSLDALFIGGSTAWKLGSAAARLANEAKQRGKWLHMGRVNSQTRLKYAQAIGCDSVDGTGYAAWPYHLLNALPVLQTQQLPIMEILLCT